MSTSYKICSDTVTIRKVRNKCKNLNIKSNKDIKIISDIEGNCVHFQVITLGNKKTDTIKYFERFNVNDPTTIIETLTKVFNVAIVSEHEMPFEEFIKY